MNRQFDVTLVTYAGAPHGAPDDQVLADAIVRLGGRVRFAVWNDPRVDWAAAPCTVVRSTWDYFRNIDAWHVWLSATQAASRLVNPHPVLLWNTDKSYLSDLERRGVAIVPTMRVGNRSCDLAHECAVRGWTDIVVKPAVGASAFGARRFAKDAIEGAARAHLRELLSTGNALVQPFQTAVERERERSLVFVAGSYRHAFSKSAFSAGAAAANAESGERDYEPTAEERDFAHRALAAAGAPVAYARVDLVPAPAGPLLMELELIEPYLALRHRPATALVLADALLNGRSFG